MTVEEVETEKGAWTICVSCPASGYFGTTIQGMPECTLVPRAKNRAEIWVRDKFYPALELAFKANR